MMVAPYGAMTPRRIRRLFGLVLVACGPCILLTVPARAKTMIGADLDYAHSAGSGIGDGWGFGVRIGQRLHAPLVALDPEIGFTYHDFNDGFAPTMYRGIAGLRLGLLEAIRPGVYGHLGVGRIDFDLASEASHTAFTYDFGAFIDFTVIPYLDLGVHAGYQGIAAGDRVDAVNWVTAGGHVNLVF
jgi:hypothetical protein